MATANVERQCRCRDGLAQSLGRAKEEGARLSSSEPSRHLLSHDSETAHRISHRQSSVRVPNLSTLHFKLGRLRTAPAFKQRVESIDTGRAKELGASFHPGGRTRAG
jgi:hypothetical protein